MKFSVVGDIMLSRHIGLSYEKSEFQIIDDSIKKVFEKSNYVIGNLESPIIENWKVDDHLVFNANKNILKEISSINFLSIANNHINDCLTKGISSTLKSIENFDFNGVYLEQYKPFTFSKFGQKFAIFTSTDMMNVKLQGKFKVPFIRDSFILDLLKKYKSTNHQIIFYAHMGQLFSRFPNPKIREISRKYIDSGADLVITVHPHVLGGCEAYKNKMIFYSLGDFVMDGNSFRRRRSSILNFDYCSSSNEFINFDMIFTNTTSKLTTALSEGAELSKSKKSWQFVSGYLASNQNLKTYSAKYKLIYKREIISHNLSTLYFLIRTKGVFKTLKLFFNRIHEVKMMIRWLYVDRSRLTKDDDAIKSDRKKINIGDLE